jgi:hypothetical protein
VSVPPHSASLLYSSILASTDRMFFISYLPEELFGHAGTLLQPTSNPVLPTPPPRTAAPMGTSALTFTAATPTTAPPVTPAPAGGVSGIVTPPTQPTALSFSGTKFSFDRVTNHPATDTFLGPMLPPC